MSKIVPFKQAPTPTDIPAAVPPHLSDRQEKVLDSIRRHVAQYGYAPSFREIGDDAGLKSPSSVKHQLQVLAQKGYIKLGAKKGRAIELIESVATEGDAITAGSENTITAAASASYRSGSHNGSETSDTAERGNTAGTAHILRFPTQRFGADAPEAGEDSATASESWDVPLVGRIAAGAPITAEQHIDDVMRLPKRLTGEGNLFMLEVHGDSMIDAAICDGDFVVVREQNAAQNGDIVAALLDGEATVKTFQKKDGHVWLMPHNPAYSPIDGTYATVMGKVVSVLRKL